MFENNSIPVIGVVWLTLKRHSLIRGFKLSIAVYRKRHSEQATKVSTTIDLVASINYSSLVLGGQSKLDEYFVCRL